MSDEPFLVLQIPDPEDTDEAGDEELLDHTGRTATFPWPTRSGKTIELTMRQTRFVHEYMKDLNANGAARRAGYKQFRGMNNNPIYKPHVQEAILDEMTYQNQALRINTSRVLAEVAQIAAMTPKEMSEYVRHGVKVSLRDKIMANELLMKHQGLFVADNKKEISITLTDLIKESYQVKARPVKVIEADYTAVEKPNEDS